jgi:hypothetical protein
MVSAQPQHSVVAPKSVEQRLVRSAELMGIALSRSTGLKERDRKLATYYALSTHALPQLQTFPILAVVGKMGTGKSQTLKIMKRFAYRAHSFSLRSMTLPAIRDELAKCDGGTVIIEEADQAWRDSDMAFERMLSDRYQRDSAVAAFKQKAGDNWATVNKRYFGATVLHRRIPFSDAALDGRSISLRFMADHSRQYEQYSDESPWNVEGSELVRELTFMPPSVEQPPAVAARIFDSYRILLGVAQLCRDEGFLDQLRPRLLLQTAELKEAQSAEPDGLVLRAILDATSGNDYAYIRVGTLAESILRNHQVALQPRQIAGLARQLGFTTKNSHGVTCVVPDPTTLLAACEECGYDDDEAVSELRQRVLGGPG